MSKAISIFHGRFGRATLYLLNRPLTPHAHREGHLVFHVEGPATSMCIEGDIFETSQETATAINPWQRHDFRPSDFEHGTLVLTLYIKPIWFLEVGRTAQSALKFGRPAIEITPQVHRSVQKVVALLLDCDDSDLFDGYLYELARECFDQSWQWTPEGLPTFQESQNFLDFRIRKSIKLLSEHLGSDELELDLVAREAGLSRPHFYKLFKMQTGITPNIYFNTLRMEKAIELLTESDRSVTDVGFDLGFSCQSGFSRFFTSNVGLSPTDYRRVTHRLQA